MNEHEMCCGTVADKAKLCAEIEQRDLRIKNLERERNELTARVTWLLCLLECAVYGERIIVGDDIVSVIDAELADEIEEALDEPPAAALYSLRAQWQADGVLKFADHAMDKYRYDFCDWAELFSNELLKRTQDATNAPNP